MIPGLSGNLITEYFAEEFLAELFAPQLDRAAAERARAYLLKEHRRTRDPLGPVCGPRQVHDLVTAPLASALGFDALSVTPAASGRLLIARVTHGSAGPVFATAAWGESLESSWREALRDGHAASSLWCIGINGKHIRIDDGRRAHARRFAQFDLDLSLRTSVSFRSSGSSSAAKALSLPAVPRPARRGPRRSTWSWPRRTETRSASAGRCATVSWRRSELLAAFLARRQARRPAPAHLASAHEQSLTIIYRVLFLLFAESRHARARLAPRLSRRLLARGRAHARGAARARDRACGKCCRRSRGFRTPAATRATCRVTPFNGRLFSPSATPLGESALLARRTGAAGVARALHPRPARRPREHRLPGPRRRAARCRLRERPGLRAGAVRPCACACRTCARAAASASPPRPSTHLGRSRRTWFAGRWRRWSRAPPRNRSSRCAWWTPPWAAGRFSSRRAVSWRRAYESALSIGRHARRRDRRDRSPRVPPSGRPAVPYGADSTRWRYNSRGCPSGWRRSRPNGRSRSSTIAWWLATASLARRWTTSGAGRRPAGQRRASAAAERLPLFDEVAIGPAFRAVLPARTRVERAAGRQPGRRPREGAPVAALGRAAVAARPLEGGARLLVCARLPGPRSGTGRGRRLRRRWRITCFRAAPVARARTRRSRLVAERGARLMRRVSPLHWSLEFPEVFSRRDGTPLPRPGFDAVVGNPPWDMVRADEDGPAGRADARDRAVAAAVLARLGHLSRAGRRTLEPLPAVRRAGASAGPDGGRVGPRGPVGTARRCRLRRPAAAAFRLHSPGPGHRLRQRLAHLPDPSQRALPCAFCDQRQLDAPALRAFRRTRRDRTRSDARLRAVTRRHFPIAHLARVDRATVR